MPAQEGWGACRHRRAGELRGPLWMFSMIWKYTGFCKKLRDTCVSLKVRVKGVG